MAKSEDTLPEEFANYLKKYQGGKVYHDNPMTISTLNQFLDKLCGKKDSEIEAALRGILLNCNPMNATWLLRIILKKMDNKFSANFVFNAINPHAYEAYKYQSDLKAICDGLFPKTPQKAGIFQIKLFCYFRPMLSEKVVIGRIGEFLQGKECSVEQKFDGHRYQIHYKDGQFKYFTRRGKDETFRFGTDFDSGRLSRFLRPALENVQEVILDGEMMKYDTVNDEFSK